MNTKIILSIVAIIVVSATAYWLISPAFRVIEQQDASPIIINDDFETMSETTKAALMTQIEILNDTSIVKEMPLPTRVTNIIAQGPFQPRAHEVKGSALLIEDDGKQILRFEDFETINGPDIRIYLSSDLGIEDSIDLGPIQATKGNVNYTLPQNVDASKYRYALVWCRAFRVLFSYAQLH